MNYGEILSSSWSNFRHHRVTWILGALAALTGGFVPSLLTALQSVVPMREDQGDPTAILEAIMFVRWFQDNLALVVIAGIGLFLFAIALSLVSLVFTGGLIAATGRIEEGERIGLKESLRLGVSRFWPFLGLVMLIGLAMVALVLLIMTPLIVAAVVAGSSEASWGVLLVLVTVGLVFLLFFPAIVVAYLVQELAVRSIVIARRGVFASIDVALNMIKTQLGRVLLAGLIIFLISIGIFVAFSIVSLPFSVPAIILNFALLQEPYKATSFLIVGSVAFIGTWIATSLAGVISAYIASYWTAAYKRLGGPMS